ncbi:hypothetical protein XBLMG947_0395 [Xanthomonas bromi]|uniref:Uncharacterized protein n=1 Tax=Xanthomonas bromi TaxID=56449 RepID=A0A1C3NGY3_9XANT|nr:hypothetical protein XBLMG947_0395 [Xanthomonas bromi]
MSIAPHEARVAILLDCNIVNPKIMGRTLLMGA